MAFECKVAKDSVAPCGARLTTFIVTYPRAIHSEIMTHRVLTKSSASSRAIPTAKLIERVLEDPWIPDYIGANQKGMQPGEELSGTERDAAVATWLDARNEAIVHADKLLALRVHKGVVNRLLEPTMWITVILSGTDLENFFGLRCHEAAEPHFQHIARMMRAAQEVSSPAVLSPGQWHMPLVFEEDYDWQRAEGRPIEDLVKVSVGRCARVSYLNHEGKRDIQADIDLHDRLMVQRPLHAAPAEHVAQARAWPAWFTESSTIPTAYRLREAVVAARRDRVKVYRAPTVAEMRAETALGELTSGNYLGFTQYRKTLTDEHIGGLMP